MVKVKIKDIVEFYNNWGTIANWTLSQSNQSTSYGNSRGTIYASVSDPGYNGGASYGYLTSDRDFSKYRLISFYANVCVKGQSSSSYPIGDYVRAKIILTDGTNSSELMSASVSSGTTGTTVQGSAFSSAFITLYIVGTTCYVYVGGGISQSSQSANCSASASLITNGTTINLSSWSSLKIRLIVEGDATGGYANGKGNATATISQVIYSKKVFGSKGELSIPS